MKYQYVSQDRLIYFIKPIGMDGPVKIGISDWPKRRLEELMSWSPFHLEIIYTFDGNFTVERRIHKRFASERVRSEWFKGTSELHLFIKQLQAGVSIDEMLTPFESAAKIARKAFLRAKRQAKKASL